MSQWLLTHVENSLYLSSFISDAFNIYTREAGGGELSLAVEGPSKAVLDVVDRGHGYTTVSYKVTQDGEEDVLIHKYKNMIHTESYTHTHGIRKFTRDVRESVTIVYPISMLYYVKSIIILCKVKLNIVINIVITFWRTRVQLHFVSNN